MRRSLLFSALPIASSFSLAAGLAACLVSCGGEPPPVPPAAPTAVLKTPPASEAAMALPPADLTAVPEPEGLVLYARLAKPSEALKVVGGWAGTPMPGAEEIGALLTGEPSGAALDLDQSIDYAVSLRGTHKRGAMSAAVKSLDAAKAAFAKYKLVPGENGALRIEGLGKPNDDATNSDDGEARVCEIAPSYGAAAARLVCGDSDDALHDLAPWLTRTATRATYPADLHVEGRLAPVRPLVEQFRRMLPLFAGSAIGVRRGESPAVDDALRAFVEDVADFTGDAEVVSFDGMIAAPQATATLTTTFRGTSSLLARLAVAHPERAATPPAAFWKLPADTDLAFFHGAVDASDFERARDRAAAILAELLGKDGLTDADRKALRDAAAHTMDLFAMPQVIGKGVDAAAAQSAMAAIGGAKEGAAREEAERAAAEKAAGWIAFEVEAPAAKASGALKEWTTAWARPGVAKWAKAHSTDAPAPSIKSAPLPAGLAGVGKDAAHLEIVAYRPHHVAKGEKKPAPGKPMILHAVVVPDGSASWIVFAADESLLVAKVKEILAGAGGQGGIGSRLASMKDAKMNAGGFLTARGLLDGLPFSWALGGYWTSLPSDAFASFAAAPDQGMTAIPFQLTSQPGGGAAPAGTFVATATVPRAAIEGVVHAILR
jgi:hypothetical protein